MRTTEQSATSHLTEWAIAIGSGPWPPVGRVASTKVGPCCGITGNTTADEAAIRLANHRYIELPR